MSTSDRLVARRSLRHIALAGVVSLSLIGLAGVAAAQETEQAPATDAPAATEPVGEPAPPIVVEPTEPTAGEETTSTETTSTEVTETTEPTESETETSAPTETTTPSEGGESQPPITLEHLSLQTDCYADGYGELWVYVRDAVGARSLSATAQGTTKEMDWDSGYHVAYFGDIAGGTFPVRVFGDGVDLTLTADASECYPSAPAPDDHFVVEVSCVDGNGVVTIQVYNPDNKSTRYYTIEVENEAGEPMLLDPYIEYPFYADVIATITEVGPDGSYVFRLYEGEKLLDEQSVTIACEAVPTTTPPAQGAPVPGGDDEGGLADTGAAVGGLAALGALALLLGGALVLSGRRRAAGSTSD